MTLFLLQKEEASWESPPIFWVHVLSFGRAEIEIGHGRV